MKNIHNPTITFQVAETEKVILAAKHLCHDVYLQVGYIDKPCIGNIIPSGHDDLSTYIVALNALQEVIGTIRLTQGPPFKTLEIWKDKLYPLCNRLITEAIHSHTFEIGALAVRKDFSPVKVSWGLYKAAYLSSIAMHLDYGIISIDARALRSLQMLGWFVQKIGEPMHYFGSLTVPAIMPVHQQPGSVLQTKLAYHKYLVA